MVGIKLRDVASQLNIDACQVDTTRQVVQLFLEKAENKIKERVGNMDSTDSKFMSISVNSMSRITKEIIDDKESQKELFAELSSRIADIMAACLTNLPQVIAMKCHTSVIEKREACIQAAARLLGETKQIINTLQNYDVPSMSPNDLPFNDKWRAYLSDP
ncbi:hypothetical protein L1987_15133 [Smallanthus sonchifolius]|uniref:Uncharacterized protein n=1 Tax=Smallanthus sonchifolius TaxID=185202 RepID=A0ACB9J7B1_9ASTR|nr:hypothetical protein L1987_15133 [Smallanthus sonchifolius]